MAAGADGVFIKVAGALSGAVYLNSLSETVAALRAEVSRLLGAPEPGAIKLILAGKALQDAQILSACGIGPASRVLVTKGAAAGAQVDAEAEKQQHLERLRRVVQGLAAGQDRNDQYSLSLENQAGSSVAFKPEDQRALVMGLTMHERGKASMVKGAFGSAQEELLLAEEAFGLCDSALTEGIDNVGMLLLDIVWCAHKLQDARRLAVCRDRLVKARQALTRAYGNNLERARKLHGAFRPELATYARLDAMEGVVAYYAQDLAAAATSLGAAQAKLQQLHVPDELLAALQEMGYKMKESKRALRFSGNDMDTAVHFIAQQRLQKEERTLKRSRQAEWVRERSQYGRTSGGAYVDVEPLDIMCGMGYDRAISAEALRQANNEASTALEVVMQPDRRAAIALTLALRNATSAVPSPPAPGAAGPSEAQSLAAALALSMSEAMHAAGGGGTASDDQGPITAVEVEAATAEAAGVSPGRSSPADSNALSPEEDGGTKRSVEDDALEAEILAGVKEGQDPMDAYDVNLEEEADIVQTYLTLLRSQAE